MTNDELRLLLPLWQEKLRIQDWRVTLRIIPMDDYGSCDCDPQDKTASVDILELDDPRWLLTDKTPDKILVHELLHVLLWELLGDNTEDPEQVIKEEQIVNFLTDALV